MGQVLSTNIITSTKDELIEDGTGHTKSLHITLECKGMIVERVLIDNGSALNVCQLITIDKLSIGCSSIREKGMMVRAFNDSKSVAMGEVDITLEIVPCQFVIPFVVIDISTTFNMLLACPWIHTTGAITSSLHQK